MAAAAQPPPHPPPPTPTALCLPRAGPQAHWKLPTAQWGVHPAEESSEAQRGQGTSRGTHGGGGLCRDLNLCSPDLQACHLNPNAAHTQRCAPTRNQHQRRAIWGCVLMVLQKGQMFFSALKGSQGEPFTLPRPPAGCRMGKGQPSPREEGALHSGCRAGPQPPGRLLPSRNLWEQKEDSWPRQHIWGN